VANTLKLFRQGAVGFIDWLDGLSAMNNPQDLTICFADVCLSDTTEPTLWQRTCDGPDTIVERSVKWALVNGCRGIGDVAERATNAG
jgi:hypothetical protein